MASLSSVARGIVFRAARLVAIAAALAAVSSAAFARPRAERVIERRVEKLEAMERRIEAAAQMPPKPADVRRALRRGEPLPARGGSQEAAAARGGPGAAARAATPRPAPPRPSAAAVARPSRASAPTPAPQPAVSEPVLRFPEDPAVAREIAAPGTAPQTPGPVAPATAIDDGTRSVLIRDQPTPAPAPAAELLPTPQAK